MFLQIGELTGTLIVLTTRSFWYIYSFWNQYNDIFVIYFILFQALNQMRRAYEEEIRLKTEVIRSQRDCLLSMVDTKRMESERSSRLKEELKSVKEELRLAKVDLTYQRGLISHLRRQIDNHDRQWRMLMPRPEPFF